MDSAQRAARERRLGKPLAAALDRLFPQADFTLDLEAAVERPGEAIVISWVDGPSPVALAAALRPYWVTGADPGEGHYPVVLERQLSAVVWCGLAWSTLRAEPALGEDPVLLRCRVSQLADALALPQALQESVCARGHLLAGLVDGHEPAGWAAWLCSTAGRQAQSVLEAVFSARGAQPTAGGSAR